MIQYEKYSWYMCGDLKVIAGDLKVIALLLGLQLGYTEFCCFLCQWDSRDRRTHFVKKTGKKNVSCKPLVDPKKVYLPPLHIRFGLINNFVKAMDRDGQDFLCLQRKFRRISDAKIKERIFIGPKIRELMKIKTWRGA
jgi:hypothetical protein